MDNIAPRSKLAITINVIKNTNMKKVLLICICALPCNSALLAQTGNTGIGTSAAGSKLTVNGSFGSAYKAVTGDYTMTAADFYVVSNSVANSTITLPIALPVGSGNYQGRLYEIKNTHTTSTVTIDGDGAELIDDVGATGVPNIMVSPGYGVLLVSTGNTSGTTWEVVSYHRTTIPPTAVPSMSLTGIIPAGTYSSYSTPATLTLPSGTYYIVPYNSNIYAATTSYSANYYGFFDVQFVSGSGISRSQVFHWSSLFTNLFTQPGFILKVTSATAVVRARLSHGDGGTFTTNGIAQFTMFFEKIE
jgi:hypothetical protein